MTLAVWLGRTLGARVVAAVLALLAVLQLTDLFEAGPRLLDEGRGAAGLGVYALLRAPDLLLQAAPVGVLAGALFGFGRLARDGATTTLRAAGLSAYRIVLLAAPVGAATALLLFGFGVWVAPPCEAALAQWLAHGEPAASAPATPRSFRLGDDIVSASRGDGAGRRLVDVDVYARDGDGRLVRHLHGREALRGPDGRWRLRGVAWERYGPASAGGSSVQAGHSAALAWTDRLDPADVRTLWTAEVASSPGAAWRGLHGGAAPQPLSAYRVQLHRLWTGPAGVLVMLLLAAPTALGQVRDGGVTRLMLAGLAGGLAFLVADGVAGAFGAAGLAPALLAVCAAPVLFAAGAVIALLHLEG